MIKYNRAKSQSKIGAHHDSFDAMWQKLSDKIINKNTSATLAIIIDNLWTACQDSKAIANEDIINEGAVWNAKSQKFMELE